MAVFVLTVFCLLLVTTCVGGPVKPRSTPEIDCNGTGCLHLDDKRTVEVSTNLTDAIIFALPNIQGLQSQMVSLMNKTLISQENVEDKLGNNEIVSLMNKTLSVVDKTESHLENIAASQNKSIVLNTMTLKSQELIETHLQNMEVILPDIQGTQNDMVSLMNKTLSVFDKTEHHLENIVLSNNETQKSQHLIETRLENMEVILENITGLMGTMVNLLQKQISGINAVYIVARDCSEFTGRGIARSGSYVFTPTDGLGSLDVYCDFIENVGWTVFQRRYDGSVDFYRNWTEYENGFGDSNGEYWLGLKNIRRLISDGNPWALRIDLESFDGESAYALYDTFSISDAASNYTLAVGRYSCTAGDSLKMTTHGGAVMHNGMQFSTFDRDNDRHYSVNCARYYQGAFWYNTCFRAHLNGKYLGRAGTNDGKGMIWYTWKQYKSLKISEMKIRRVL